MHQNKNCIVSNGIGQISMKFKDYYDILGVSEDADEKTIKTAYRKLARQYHPDVSKAPDAEEKIKEVNEAYEVLKDKQKRAQFDQLRRGGWQQGEEFTPPPGWGGYRQEDFGQMHDFADLFSSLFGGGGGASPFHRARPQAQRGQDLNYRIQLSLEDAYSGVERTITIRVPEYTPQGFVHEANKTLKVKIPAGVTSGQKIRLAGKGQPGQHNGPNGDLLLEVDLQKHPQFTLEGKNIHSNVNIMPWQAALGDQVPVRTLGGTVKIKIPAGAESGQKLRLTGKGLPGNPAGNHLVQIMIQTPKADSDEAKAFYTTMAEEFTPK